MLHVLDARALSVELCSFEHHVASFLAGILNISLF